MQPHRRAWHHQNHSLQFPSNNRWVHHPLHNIHCRCIGHTRHSPIPEDFHYWTQFRQKPLSQWQEKAHQSNHRHQNLPPASPPARTSGPAWRSSDCPWFHNGHSGHGIPDCIRNHRHTYKISCHDSSTPMQPHRRAWHHQNRSLQFPSNDRWAHHPLRNIHCRCTGHTRHSPIPEDCRCWTQSHQKPLSQ